MDEEKISKGLEDFIDILFALIVAVGFTFFVDPYLKNFSLTINALITFFLFVTTYFFIISDWIFYHELMLLYPYKNYGRFFFDIIMFFLLFLLTYLTFEAKNTKFIIYILAVAIWHFTAIFWHYFAQKDYSDAQLKFDKSICQHTLRFGTFFGIIIFYLIFNKLLDDKTIVFPSFAIVVMFFMWYFNLKRLNDFKNKKIQS